MLANPTQRKKEEGEEGKGRKISYIISNDTFIVLPKHAAQYLMGYMCLISTF